MSMNHRTKKIRKSNRKHQPNPLARELVDLDSINRIDVTDEDSLEVLTASFANLQNFIEEARFYEIVNGEVINKLISCLRHSNPQIVVNTLYAFQNMFRICSSYDKKIFETMCLNLNLLAAVEQVQLEVCQALPLIAKNINLPHVTCALLSFLTEFLEVCQPATLKQIGNSSLFNGTLSLIVNLLDKPISEEVYICLMNYLQILGESLPKLNELVATSNHLLSHLNSIFQGNFQGNEVLQSSSFTFKQKLQSLLLIVMFNIIHGSNQQIQPIQTKGFKDTVEQLMNNVLTVNIFREVENVKQLVETGNLLPVLEKIDQTQIVEEEEEPTEKGKEQPTINLDEDKKVKNALSIWLDTADSIIEQLKFLARIYEGADYEDDDDAVEIEEEVEQQQQQQPPQRSHDEQISQLLPSFFEPNFQQSLLRLLLNNFISLEPLVIQNEFIQRLQGYKLALYLKEAGLMIVNAALSTLSNICNSSTVESNLLRDLVSAIHRQIELILSSESVIFEDRDDREELLDTYLKCYIVLLGKDQALITQIPECALLLLAQKMTNLESKNEDLTLHMIELLKLRYNYKILNSLQSISELTDLLLLISNKSQPLVGSQALDCLFDVYTEEDYNSILQEKNVLTLLWKGYEFMKPLIPTLRSKLPAENFKFVKVTHTNLKDFIDYKKKVMGKK